MRQEQLDLVAKRVAQSMAYDYFIRYLFGFETQFNDLTFNCKTGLVQTDLNSSF